MCRQVLVKFPITKCHKNPFFGTELIAKRRTDRYDETNRHISTSFISNAPTTNTLSRRRHVVVRNMVLIRSKLCSKSEDKQTQGKFLQEPQRSPTLNSGPTVNNGSSIYCNPLKIQSIILKNRNPSHFMCKNLQFI
jgi:hypothetical protein